MRARYQHQRLIGTAHEACRLATDAQRISPLLPSLLPPIPEEPEDPMTAEPAGKSCAYQMCVYRVSPAAVANLQQRKADFLFSAYCISTPRYTSDGYSHEQQDLRLAMPVGLRGGARCAI